MTAAPVIDPVVLEGLVVGEAGELVPRADLEGVEFVDVQVDRIELDHASFYATRFANLRAGEAELGAAKLSECVVERADVPVLRAVRGRWRDVEVRGARIGSAELYESTWDSVRFVDCKLGFVNLRGAALQDVVFSDCTIDELDLVQATAARVAFHGTRIDGLDVQGSTLDHVDLRGATLSELRGTESLRGATIDPTQLTLLAPAFATALGVVVQD